VGLRASTYVVSERASGTTLTTSDPPKHEIVTRSDHAILIVDNIDESDVGEYQCNFVDEDGRMCFPEVIVELDIEFCTPDSVTYHKYIGASVTLKCCVKNHMSQYWRRGDSDEAITESEDIEF
jgi:hypothetical protein